MGGAGFVENQYNSGVARCYQHHAPLTTTPYKEGIVADRKCNRCGEVKPLEAFKKHPDCKLGRSARCMACELAYMREYRRASGNGATRRYEKTKRGFLMRLYRNMQSRVTGVQQQKIHLYAGKSLLPRAQFYEWAITHPSFHELFAAWEAAGYARQYAPTVDRIDSGIGYEAGNMQWLTHSENSRLGNESRIRQGLHKRQAA